MEKADSIDLAYKDETPKPLHIQGQFNQTNSNSNKLKSKVLDQIIQQKFQETNNSQSFSIDNVKLPKIKNLKKKVHVKLDSYPFLTERSRLTIDTQNNSNINDFSVNNSLVNISKQSIIQSNHNKNNKSIGLSTFKDKSGILKYNSQRNQIDDLEFNQRNLDEIIEEAQQEIEDPENIHKRLKDQMFPQLKQSKSLKEINSMKQLRKSTLHTKSLQTLKSTQILYQRFIEKQFDDDLQFQFLKSEFHQDYMYNDIKTSNNLDRQAMEAGGGEYVYHKQIQPDQEDEDYYMKKRKFLSNDFILTFFNLLIFYNYDTLSMLNDKYQYNSNFKITDNQMQISNEYLLKVRNMYNELKQGGYTLDKPDYMPYSASKQNFLNISKFHQMTQITTDFHRRRSNLEQTGKFKQFIHAKSLLKQYYQYINTSSSLRFHKHDVVSETLVLISNQKSSSKKLQDPSIPKTNDHA